MPRGNFKRAIAKNILNNTITATSWVFETLIFMSELTIETFLNPSYYGDISSSNWGVVGDYKPKPKKNPEFKEVTIRQSIRRLRKQGFVQKEGSKYLLTKKGKELARYVLNRKKSLEREWDKKYRVVIFDIPEKNHKLRDWLRSELCLLKYKKLQESVFIGKYPLTTDLIKEIKRLKLGNFVNYLLVDKVYKNIP